MGIPLIPLSSASSAYSVPWVASLLLPPHQLNLALAHGSKTRKRLGLCVLLPHASGHCCDEDFSQATPFPVRLPLPQVYKWSLLLRLPSLNASTPHSVFHPVFNCINSSLNAVLGTTWWKVLWLGRGSPGSLCHRAVEAKCTHTSQL